MTKILTFQKDFSDYKACLKEAHEPKTGKKGNVVTPTVKTAAYDIPATAFEAAEVLGVQPHSHFLRVELWDKAPPSFVVEEHFIKDGTHLQCDDRRGRFKGATLLSPDLGGRDLTLSCGANPTKIYVIDTDYENEDFHFQYIFVV